MEDVQGLGDPFSTEAGNYCKRKQLSWEIPENIILKLGQWLGAHHFQFFEKTSDNFTLHCTAWSIRLLIEKALSTKTILIWIGSLNLFPQILAIYLPYLPNMPCFPPFAPRPEKDTRRFSVRRAFRDRGLTRASEAEAFRGTKWVTEGPHVSSDVDVNTRLGPVIPVIFLQGIHNSTDFCWGWPKKKLGSPFLSKAIYRGYT